MTDLVERLRDKRCGGEDCKPCRDCRNEELEAADEIERLREEVDDWERLADLQRKREKPHLERWREETGQPLHSPDYGAMLAWLFDEIERLEKALDKTAAFSADQSAEIEKLRRQKEWYVYLCEEARKLLAQHQTLKEED